MTSIWTGANSAEVSGAGADCAGDDEPRFISSLARSTGSTLGYYYWSEWPANISSIKLVSLGLSISRSVFCCSPLGSVPGFSSKVNRSSCCYFYCFGAAPSSSSALRFFCRRFSVFSYAKVLGASASSYTFYSSGSSVFVGSSCLCSTASGSGDLLLDSSFG